MSTFKTKNSLRTIDAQIEQKLKNNEARPKFTGSYKKKACAHFADIIIVGLVDAFYKASLRLVTPFFIRTNFIRTPRLRF